MIYTETSVTRYLTRWCADHLGKHDSPQYSAYMEHFQRYLDLKREEQGEAHSNGGRFGMSSAAGCLRANALKRAGVKGKPLDGDSAVTFEIGHLLECMALAVLSASGFTVTRVQETIRLDPAFQSAMDGVLEAGPVNLPYPVILSVKTASYKSSSPPRGKNPAKRYGFAQLPLDGIRRAQPSWYVQGQLEMAATGIGHAFVLVLAKDMIAAFRGDSVFENSGSLSWYAELLKADRDLAEGMNRSVGQYLSARPETAIPVLPVLNDDPKSKFYVVRLPRPGDVESGWKGPNQEATGSFNPCFGCQYGGQPEICK